MALCCFYEELKTGAKKTLCTSDPKCPEIEGFKRLGSWSVDKCDDCFRSRECADGGAPPDEVRWEKTTPAKMRELIPAGATIWVGTPAAAATVASGKTAAGCRTVANVVICTGDCPDGQRCRAEPGKFIRCTCQ